MPDTISSYRQVRLVINLANVENGRTYWSLHFVGVYKGVPRSKVVLDGYVAEMDPMPTVEEVLEAIAAVASQSMLHQ